jgi:hypothetical protein
MTSLNFEQNGKKIPLSGQTEKGDSYFDLASPLQAGEKVLVMGL